MITLLHTDIVFTKIRHQFMIIILSISGRKGSFLNPKRIGTPKSTG